MPSTVPRVLFLGLDGGTQTVFQPLFERGWMPHLAHFWHRAATGKLRSTTPMVTPVAWSSFLTGCTPSRHGIHDFCYYDSQARAVGINDADRMHVPTLWHLLDAAGLSVVSLNLPMTYPAPQLQGLVVSGAESPDRASAFSQCPWFGRELAVHEPAYTPKNLWKTRPRSLGELQALCERTRKVFLAQAAAAERADTHIRWSALMVHFHNLDGLQHRMWPELALTPEANPDPTWVHEVESCYRALDEAVGRLLELASKREAAVIAVSDHGFGPCHALVNVNGLLQQAGLQRRLAYGTRFRYRMQRLRDRYARWKLRDQPGRAARLLRSVDGEVGCDWRRTRAFAPFGQLAAFVFVSHNTPRAARESTIRELVGIFRSARDPETGACLFSDAFDVGERYQVDPSEWGLPDMLAPSSEGFQAQAKWSPFDSSLLRPDPALPATHWMDGVIAIDAPGVRPGNDLRASLEDLAPTTLKLLGLDPPDTMEGRVLSEILQPFSRGRRRADASHLNLPRPSLKHPR